jgi:PrtD family type I secretion system ABC transporter
MLNALRLSDRPDAPWHLPRKPLLAVAGFSFMVNLLLLMPSLFILQVFDRVFASGSRDTLLVLLVGVSVALLLSLALDHLRSRLQGLLGNWLGEALLPDVLRELMTRGARGHAAASPEALRDVGTLRSLFSAQGLLAIFDAPWAVIYVAIIWVAHPALGAAAAAAALLMLGLAVVNDRMTRRDIETLQRDASAAQRYLEASLANAEAAEAMGMSDALLGRWRELNAKVTALQGRSAGRTVALAAATRSARQAVQVIITAVGAWLVITQESTAGVMVATTILLGRALAPVEQIVGSWKLLVEGRIAAARLRELLGPRLERSEPMSLPPPVGQIDVHAVVSRPPGVDRIVLGGVSFSIAAGESLAIIGPSGAGKSTLIRVLSGLWRPVSGIVRLDGADLAQWPRAQLGPHIGYVPQGIELFSGTVAENIARLGDVNADAVVTAAKAARVHDMILSLPQGYETRFEPGITLLSPGQRQRIALARALYGQPRLLLLDEPNSNLDGEGEVALGEALAALRGKVTMVMVTHRSTLIQHADRLLVLEAGRIKHYGPTGEVLQAMKGVGGQVVPMPRPAQAEGSR